MLERSKCKPNRIEWKRFIFSIIKNVESNALFRSPSLWSTVAKSDKANYKQLSFSQPKRTKVSSVKYIAKAKYFSGIY